MMKMMMKMMMMMNLRGVLVSVDDYVNASVSMLPRLFTILKVSRFLKSAFSFDFVVVFARPPPRGLLEREMHTLVRIQWKRLFDFQRQSISSH